jgi:flagellar assembly protein FliH
VTARGRIVPAEGAANAVPLLDPDAAKAGDQALRHRVVREEAEAREAAGRIVREARATADSVIAEAGARAAAEAQDAARRTREDADAELTARWLALRQAERTAAGRDEDRIVSVAVALAERLLGASLAVEPGRIADLARVVIGEAGGARRAVIEAHPLDAEELQRSFTAGGLDLQSVEVRGDAALARGELRLHTDLGTIDARLAPRFERLAAALRDALG